MKPVVIWQLQQQEAFDRAIALRFGQTPRPIPDFIESFRQRLIDGIAACAQKQSPKPLAEYTVQYGLQKHPYQKRGEVAPKQPPAPQEEWLELRYRFIDEETVEIIAVTPKNLPPNQKG